jgi:hypothetical protein
VERDAGDGESAVCTSLSLRLTHCFYLAQYYTPFRPSSSSLQSKAFVYARPILALPLHPCRTLRTSIYVTLTSHASHTPFSLHQASSTPVRKPASTGSLPLCIIHKRINLLLSTVSASCPAKLATPTYLRAFTSNGFHVCDMPTLLGNIHRSHSQRTPSIDAGGV